MKSTLLFAVLALAVSADAVPITYDFAGTLTKETGPWMTVDPFPGIGSQIAYTGTVSFDPDVPYGSYEQAAYSVTFGGFTFASGPFYYPMQNNPAGFIIASYVGPLFQTNGGWVNPQDMDLTVGSTTDMSQNAFTLDGYFYGPQVITSDSWAFTGTVDCLTQVPDLLGTLAALAASVGLLAALEVRRRSGGALVPRGWIHDPGPAQVT